MEELLTAIGELCATELEQTESITYLKKDFGYSFIITTKNNNRILLSLINLEEEV